MTNIHIYEYDGGSMPGTVNGYWEIYEGEYHDGTFLASADNSNVFCIAMELANERNANIHIQTIANWYAEQELSDPYDSMSLSTTKEN